MRYQISLCWKNKIKSETKRRKLRRRRKKKKKNQQREGWLTHVERELGEKGGGAPPNRDGDSRAERGGKTERELKPERGKERERETLGFFS